MRDVIKVMIPRLSRNQGKRGKLMKAREKLARARWGGF